MFEQRLADTELETLIRVFYRPSVNEFVISFVMADEM